MTAPTYYIDYTDKSVDPSKASFTIPPGAINTDTSLKLPGAGFSTYGEFIDEDLLHMVEHFASATAPVNPTIGQIWFDTSVKRLKVLSAISKVGSTTTYTWDQVSNNTGVSTTPPTDTSQLWYDVSDANPINHTLKIYNTAASAWQPVVPRPIQTGVTAPTNTNVLWFNTSNASNTKYELYAYNASRAGWYPAVSHDASMLTGSVPNSVLSGSSIGGNAATATLATAALKLNTARTISLTGGAIASGTFDGSTDLTLNVTSINANIINQGTVPINQLGSAGTRAAGYYLAGNNIWTQFPAIPDAYSKTQIDSLLANKLNINGTAVSANNVNGMTATDILNTAYARVGTMGKRDLYVSTGDPVAGTGVVGDVWFKY